MEGSLSRHHARVVWEGTKRDLRAHRIELADERLACSSAAELGGDPERADPEQMFVASLASCHMLWFLALARDRSLRVEAYTDDAVGTLERERITAVELRPAVRFDSDPGAAVLAELHEQAHERCFLAASVNFPVTVTGA